MREGKDMGTISRRQFVKGAAGITSTVFATTCVGAPVAQSYRGRINTALGIDIQAACGQLRRDADQQKQTAAQTVKNESGNTLFGGGKN